MNVVSRFRDGFFDMDQVLQLLVVALLIIGFIGIH